MFTLYPSGACSGEHVHTESYKVFTPWKNMKCSSNFWNIWGDRVFPVLYGRDGRELSKPEWINCQTLALLGQLNRWGKTGKHWKRPTSKRIKKKVKHEGICPVCCRLLSVQGLSLIWLLQGKFSNWHDCVHVNMVPVSSNKKQRDEEKPHWGHFWSCRNPNQKKNSMMPDALPKRPLSPSQTSAMREKTTFMDKNTEQHQK